MLRHNGVWERRNGYVTDVLTDAAIKFIEAKDDKPFFVYLPFNCPHSPHQVPAEYREHYSGKDFSAAAFPKKGHPMSAHNDPDDLARVYGMIENIDDNVGRLLAKLDELKLTENTIVILFSDNGCQKHDGYNAGFRGWKGTPYEGGIHQFCFVRWPAGNLRKPSAINEPAQMQDLLPTLIDLCQLKKPASAQFDGTSLAQMLKGKDDKGPDRMLVVQYGQQLKKWDSNVMWHQWRLINGTELYDFHEEPSEKTDLSARNPQVVKKMRDHYEAWWNRVEPALREFEPISIGSPKENPVTLTSSDWEEIYCDNVNSILSGEGGPQGGPWAILVERGGEYEIALRRWPVRTGLALDAPCPEKQMTMAKLPAGKAFPIAQAQLQIAGQSKSVKTAAGSQSAVFRVTLKAGTRTKLQAWFQDADGKDLCGAYYAYVRHIG